MSTMSAIPPAMHLYAHRPDREEPGVVRFVSQPVPCGVIFVALVSDNFSFT